MSKESRQRDSFWEEVVIPFNEHDLEVSFANPVTVSENFIRAISQGAQLGSQAERLIRRLKILESNHKAAVKDYAKFKQEILAKFYDEVTKTASPDIMAAFIRRKAEEDNREDELTELLEELDNTEELVEETSDQLDILKDRMRFLDKSMEWAKQYLDYDKLQERLEDKGRRTK